MDEDEAAPGEGGLKIGGLVGGGEGGGGRLSVLALWRRDPS